MWIAVYNNLGQDFPNSLTITHSRKYIYIATKNICKCYNKQIFYGTVLL